MFQQKTSNKTILGMAALASCLALPLIFSQGVYPQTNPVSQSEISGGGAALATQGEAAGASGVVLESARETLAKEVSSLGEAPPKNNLFGSLRQGGWIMGLLGGMLLLGMTMVIERGLFFLKVKAWKPSTVEGRLADRKKKSRAQNKSDFEAELWDDMQLFFNDLESGLALIHGLGNLAPLIGFFGTVIGMIQAFSAIASAAVVNAKVVAVGIQVALVTTAGGLAVAVFTLSFYHAFAHLIQRQLLLAQREITGAVNDFEAKGGDGGCGK